VNWTQSAQNPYKGILQANIYTQENLRKIINFIGFASSTSKSEGANNAAQS
jgi:hypothetical protein